MQQEFFVAQPPSLSKHILPKYSGSRDSFAKKFLKLHNDDHQLEQDFLTKALSSEYPLLKSLSLEKVVKEDVGKDFSEFMYTALVYTVNNIFGSISPSAIEPQALKTYIDGVFRLPPQIRCKLSEKAKSIKPPKYFLQVTINKAVDLIPCDADGLCDPYCKLWTSSYKDIVTTTVKEPTLNPTWDESFILQLKDFNQDFLHIEVWDKDPESFSDNLRELKARGAKGGWIFCQEICQNLFSCLSGSVDDFIGRVGVALKDIYSEGIEIITDLKDKKGKSMKGQIHFFAKFIGSRPKSISESLKRHMMLFKTFFQHSLREGRSFGDAISQWEQALPPAALTLMLLHQVQSSLSAAEDLLVRFIVYVFTLQSEHNFDFQFLHRTVEDTNHLVQQLISDECGFDSKNLLNLYKNAISMVYNECELILNGIRSINFSDEVRCLEFEYVLKCLELSCEILSKSFPWSSIKSEAVSWFEKVAEEIQGKDPKIRTDFVIKTTHSILNFYAAVDAVIKKVFPHQSYSLLTYETLDCVFSNCLKTHLRMVSEESKTDGDVNVMKAKEEIELFHKIKELNEYLCNSLPQPVADLSNFRDWFGSNLFKEWFQCKQVIIAQKIPQLVSNERLENIVIECAERTEKQGSSVRPTVNLIQVELVSLWVQISDPKCSELNHIFLQVLHFSCMVYTNCLLDLIHSKKLVKTFRHSGKKKLCVIANNLWSLSIFVRETIAKTVEDLPPDSFHTKFILQLICRLICEGLSKEMQLDVLDIVEKVIMSRTKKSQSKAIAKYSQKLRSLLQEGKECMAFEIYLLYLGNIWKFIVEVVGYYNSLYKDWEARFSVLRKFCKRPSVLQSLYAILTEAEKLCYIDPEGRLKPVMWTDDYVLLKKELQQQITYG